MPSLENIQRNERPIHNDRPTIRFSEQAWLTIKEDYENFSKGEPLSTFLNTIFLNFYNEANCNLIAQMDKTSDRFYDLVESLRLEGHTIDASVNAFTQAYLDAYKATLLENFPTFQDGEHGEKVRLDANTQKALQELQTAEYHNDKFYWKKFGKIQSDESEKTAIDQFYGERDTFVKLFLRAFFEEYTSLPTYRREEIYLKDFVDKISNAKKDGKKIKVYLAPRFNDYAQEIRQSVYYVSPYKIERDPSNNFNYLVGYAQEERDGQPLEGKIPSFRLSNIADIRVCSKKSLLTKPQHFARIEKDIREKGIQFLAGTALKVTVKFTQKGLDNLKHQLYMRPFNRKLLEGTTDTYVFTCTKVQAINYFFKFGKHAYIVEPVWLREEFKKRYLVNYNSYKEKEELEKKKEEE